MSPDCKSCGKRFRSHEELRKHLSRRHRDKVKLAILEHPTRQK
jgi:hypothetical protein